MTKLEFSCYPNQTPLSPPVCQRMAARPHTLWTSPDTPGAASLVQSRTLQPPVFSAHSPPAFTELALSSALLTNMPSIANINRKDTGQLPWACANATKWRDTPNPDTPTTWQNFSLNLSFLCFLWPAPFSCVNYSTGEREVFEKCFYNLKREIHRPKRQATAPCSLGAHGRG